MPDEYDPLSETGWCRLGSNTQPSTRRECNEVGGEFFEEEPGGICIVVTTSTYDGDPALSFLRGLRKSLVTSDKTAANLWERYSPKYYKMSGPIVRLMLRDRTVRRMMRTVVVSPAVLGLRAMSLELAGRGDEAVLEEVRRGILELRNNIAFISDGVDVEQEQLTKSVLDSLASMSRKDAVG